VTTLRLRDIYTRSVTMPGMRVIRCDCGFEATGDGDEELVSRAQAHARGVHGIDVPADLVLDLAESKAPQEKA
jgi:predicted small metal-binding protein